MPNPPSPLDGDRRLHERLRALAHRLLHQGLSRPTLQTTELVHEAFVRLLKNPQTEWKDRSHLFHLCAKAMRAVLVDRLRRRNTEKRGGEWKRIPLDDVVDLYENSARDLVRLDAALEELQRLDPRLATITELRFFVGLTEEQTASVLNLSTRTVQREWRSAKVWLRLALEQGNLHDSPPMEPRQTNRPAGAQATP